MKKGKRKQELIKKTLFSRARPPGAGVTGRIMELSRGESDACVVLPGGDICRPWFWGLQIGASLHNDFAAMSESICFTARGQLTTVYLLHQQKLLLQEGQLWGLG